MTRYIALLRGINVGKNNRVAMADLRRILADLDAADVKTLLQSGNAVFTSPSSAAKISDRLGRALRDELDVDVPVVVRTAAELRQAISGDPFADIADDPAKHLLGFCSKKPTAAAVRALGEAIAARQAKGGAEGGADAGDQWKLTGDHVYLWCPVNVHQSVFATVKWDKLLGVEVTMRNFATVSKLAELAD